MKKAKLAALFAAAALCVPRTTKAQAQDYYIFNNGIIQKVTNSDPDHLPPKYWSYWVLYDRTIPREGIQGHQCNSFDGKTVGEAHDKLEKFAAFNTQFAKFMYGKDWEAKLTNCSGKSTVGPVAVMSGSGLGNSAKAVDALKGANTTPVRFSRPSIAGVRLNQASINLLKTESDKLRLAGMTKGLLAWSPLILLTGESDPGHVVLSIQQTDWEELARSMAAVNNTLFNSLATDARMLANSDATWGNPQLKQFWNAMADFYASRTTCTPGLSCQRRSDPSPDGLHPRAAEVFQIG